MYDFIYDMWSYLANHNHQTEYQKLSEACQNLRNANNLMAMETVKIIDNNEVYVRPIVSLTETEYQNLRSEADPSELEQLLSSAIGFFFEPKTIFIDTSLDQHEIERTIIHEIRHYQNHCLDPEMDVIADEMSAIEAEDRYSGLYITRSYMRKLKEYVLELFAEKD